MSIKSDRWIRRMAERGMIEPFEAGHLFRELSQDDASGAA